MLIKYILYFNLPNSNQLAQIDCLKLKLCLSFLRPFDEVHAQFPFSAKYLANDLRHEYS